MEGQTPKHRFKRTRYNTMHGLSPQQKRVSSGGQKAVVIPCFGATEKIKSLMPKNRSARFARPVTDSAVITSRRNKRAPKATMRA